MAASIGRLGPIYDAADLKKTIESLTTKTSGLESFFGTEPREVPVCQGDIFKLDSSRLPFINASGDASAVEHSSGLWQILGNTCDLTRSIEEVTYSQIAPVQLFLPDGGAAIDTTLIQYKAYRCFYVPPVEALGTQHLLTDLTRPVTVHKQTLSDSAVRVARLSVDAWMLFHCVLVRFLARNDGRFT